MKNDGSDNRVHRKKQYSRMVIRKAFLDLLEKKPLNKITVKEVCDLANVNRTTFYGNFYDIYDVLEQIQAEFYQSIETSVKKADYQGEALFEIFEIIKENIDLCKILFSSNNEQSFIQKVMMIPYAYIMNEWTSKTKLTDISVAYLFEFCANGCVAFMRKWVLEGAKIPAKNAAKLLQDFISANLVNSSTQNS